MAASNFFSSSIHDVGVLHCLLKNSSSWTVFSIHTRIGSVSSGEPSVERASDWAMHDIDDVAGWAKNYPFATGITAASLGNDSPEWFGYSIALPDRLRHHWSPKILTSLLPTLLGYLFKISSIRSDGSGNALVLVSIDISFFFSINPIRCRQIHPYEY